MLGSPCTAPARSSSLQRCRQTWKRRSPRAQTVGTMVRCSLRAQGWLCSVLRGPRAPQAAAGVTEPVGQGELPGDTHRELQPHAGRAGGDREPPPCSVPVSPHRGGVPAPAALPGQLPAHPHHGPQPPGLPQVEEEALVLAALQGLQGEEAWGSVPPGLCSGDGGTGAVGSGAGCP